MYKLFAIKGFVKKKEKNEHFKNKIIFINFLIQSSNRYKHTVHMHTWLILNPILYLL